MAIPSGDKQLTFGSLFAGIGGFDAAFQESGMHCVWQIEINKDCQAVERYYDPSMERYRDVKSVSFRHGKGWKQYRHPTPVDLVCGGFPCQDLSVAGRRAGLAGKRSGLWWEFARLLKELCPRWVVIENVPGLLSSNERRDMGILCGTLAQLGYWWAYRVLDAQYFGVAQRRRRVFIVGHLTEPTYPAKVLFEPESCERDIAPSRETGARVAGTIAAGAHPSGFNGRDAERGNLIANCLGSHHGRNDPNEGGLIATGCDAQRMRIRDASGISPTLSQSDGGGGQRTPLVAYGFSQESDGSTIRNAGNIARPVTGRHGDPGIVAYNIQQNDGGNHKRKDRLNGGMYVNETEQALTVGSTDQTVIAFSRQDDGRNAVRNLSPTLRVGTSISGMKQQSYICAIQHSIIGRKPEAGAQGKGWRDDGAMWTLDSRGDADAIASQEFGVRRLTPIECERLQGFPDDHTAWGVDENGERVEMSDSARYRMLGNAVCINVAEWIGRRIMELEDS